MVDIHCHILPGVDDGARSLTESIMMAREAAKQGITRITATPHHQNGEFTNTGDQILGIVHYLNGKLQEEQVPIEILPGQETRIYGELLSDLKKGDIIPLNRTSNYVLIDLPENHVPQYINQLFFDLLIDGYKPIITNPEKNKEFIQHPDQLYRLVKNGALTQIKASSIIGKLGKKIQTFTHQILQANLAHFIASDAHNSKKDGFLMQKAYQQVDRIHGSTYSYQLKENSEALITGHQIQINIPDRIRNKKMRKIFKR